MPGTSVERHTGNTVAIADDHYLDRIPQLAEQLARSGMCPEPFRNKPDDIAIVGYSLADNGLRLSLNTLPQCYVIKGKPGYMAQIQTAMAAMHGVTIRPVADRCDEKGATVEVILADRTRHEVTFTMAEAQRAKLHENPGNMYQKFPTNMLVARAVTRAISWYCPAVKLGLAGTVDVEELDYIDAETDDSEDTVHTGENGEDGADSGELVAPAEAKEELIAAYVARGSTREEAIPCARLLWESHGLTKGQPILRSRLDLIVALLKDAPPRQAAGEPVEAVTPEVVHADAGPAEQPAFDYDADEAPFD